MTNHLSDSSLLDIFNILLPPANEVCEGYVFTGICLSTGGGGVRGRVEGGSALQGGWHAWWRSVHGRGLCMAGSVCSRGCMHGGRGACVAGWHAWQGGMCGGGHAWGVCMAWGMHSREHPW